MRKLKLWFKELFNSSKLQELENEVETLKAKLLLKQEQINKTNAYYKKKLRESNKKTKK